MGKLVTREWRSEGGPKELNWNLQSFQLLEIIQVLDSISWVRCASGNVFTCAFSLIITMCCIVFGFKWSSSLIGMIWRVWVSPVLICFHFDLM